MAIDPLSGSWTVVVDESQVGDPSPPFFNPMDITIYRDGFYAAVPEPGSALVAGLAFAGIALRRRKS